MQRPRHFFLVAFCYDLCVRRCQRSYPLLLVVCFFILCFEMMPTVFRFLGVFFLAVFVLSKPLVCVRATRLGVPVRTGVFCRCVVFASSFVSSSGRGHAVTLCGFFEQPTCAFPCDFRVSARGQQVPRLQVALRTEIRDPQMHSRTSGRQVHHHRLPGGEGDP